METKLYDRWFDAGMLVLRLGFGLPEEPVG